MALIEGGGIGTVRLLPRRIDGDVCWFATALTGVMCHGGIPLAIPDALLCSAGVNWGDRCNLRGRVRFLRDAGLDAAASRVHHARPLIVFVEELEGLAHQRSAEPITITPVALFANRDPDRGAHYKYTFVHCEAGLDAEIDSAVEWIEKYAAKYAGQVITNFDEQRPFLADAPLSYQRLVAKTYDRLIINKFSGPILVSHIDQVVHESVTTQYIGVVRMGHEINVGGSAIINIDAVLTNVSQTIGGSTGLDASQKSQLDALVESIKADLARLKESHADEAKAIAESLERAVASAAKPPQERKEGILRLSANGLKEAAALVAGVAPNIVKTAGLIAKFIMDLVKG